MSLLSPSKFMPSEEAKLVKPNPRLTYLHQFLERLAPAILPSTKSGRRSSHKKSEVRRPSMAAAFGARRDQAS